MSYLSDAAWTQEERPDFYDGDDYDEEKEEEVAFAPLTAGQEAKVREVLDRLEENLAMQTVSKTGLEWGEVVNELQWAEQGGDERELRACLHPPRGAAPRPVLGVHGGAERDRRQRGRYHGRVRH